MSFYSLQNNWFMIAAWCAEQWINCLIRDLLVWKVNILACPLALDACLLSHHCVYRQRISFLSCLIQTSLYCIAWHYTGRGVQSLNAQTMHQSNHILGAKTQERSNEVWSHWRISGVAIFLKVLCVSVTIWRIAMSVAYKRGWSWFSKDQMHAGLVGQLEDQWDLQILFCTN